MQGLLFAIHSGKRKASKMQSVVHVMKVYCACTQQAFILDVFRSHIATIPLKESDMRR